MMAATITLPGNGLVAEVERRGRGAPLVYLHGAFGLEWSAPLVDALARSHEVIAPKLPGYGASEGLERIRSFHDMSVWLDEVLDALGLERVALAGHDFGGAAAAEYAALFRRRVERLVLVAPDGFASPGFEYDRAPEIPATLSLMRWVLPRLLLSLPQSNWPPQPPLFQKTPMVASTAQKRPTARPLKSPWRAPTRWPVTCSTSSSTA
jgi:pimeloyl-ACP methyl ester carboxylesterase